jgi:tRNA dimethylallyltransferase
MPSEQPNVPIHVITGPTASGKTARALEVAGIDPTIEIVNADAVLLYKGFDIGTAKPSPEERRHVPHHLIDLLEPTERFSAADFSRVARETIRDILTRGKTPLVVGGTGFYIDALFDGLMLVTADEDSLAEATTRARSEIASLGFDAMLDKLLPIDPILHRQINRERNPIRLERAWQHYYATGEALGEARQRKSEPFEYRPHFEVLLPPRDVLWQRIEARVDQMLQRGWLGEARKLRDSGVTRDMPAMSAIGYREIFDVLDGAITMEDARHTIIIQTRQYAKRQRTWMKRYLTR